MTFDQVQNLSDPALEACLNYFYFQKTQFKQKANEMDEQLTLVLNEIMLRDYDKRLQTQVLLNEINN